MNPVSVSADYCWIRYVVYPKKNVLRIIDCMAMLKINKLHFHLTDDNGFQRIEIRNTPVCGEAGAWRVDRTDVPFHSRRNRNQENLSDRRFLHAGGHPGNCSLCSREQIRHSQK